MSLPHCAMGWSAVCDVAFPGHAFSYKQTRGPYKDIEVKTHVQAACELCDLNMDWSHLTMHIGIDARIGL